MSISSLPAPAPDTSTPSSSAADGAGKTGNGDGAGKAAATGFAALLAGALAGIGIGGKSAGKTGLGLVASDVLGSKAGDAEAVIAETTVQSVDPALLAAAGVVAAAQPQLVAQAIAQTTAQATAQATAGAGGADGSAAGTAVTGVAGTAATSPTAAAADGPALATGVTEPAPAASSTTAATGAAAAVLANAAADSSAGGSAGDADTKDKSDAPPALATDGEPAPTADLTALSTSTAAAPVTAPSSANGSTAVSHVANQVFPEVAKLATLGNGTHRLTLKLHPENLGEVRVTLTMRDGAVRVTMSGSDEANRSLLAGSTELHRLLAATGAIDTHVNVRDNASGDLLGQSRQDSARQQADNSGFGSGNHDSSSRGFGEPSGREDRARPALPTDGTASTLSPPGSAQKTDSGVDVTV